ncbi:hypothetical protein LCGC14_1935480 [marine sediment metagenome]|uniref:Uncharacterized protein n=1 Tax=marine sediment metagenome TaxID=412755 RepID=A0A0F9I0E5_9ZZZZ
MYIPTPRRLRPWRRLPMVVDDALFVLALYAGGAWLMSKAFGSIPGFPLWPLVFFLAYVGWVHGYAMGSRPMGPR